jgi:hypothetical protein
MDPFAAVEVGQQQHRYVVAGNCHCGRMKKARVYVDVK